MGVNFNPANKVTNPNKAGQQKQTTQTTGSQERNQVSWDQTLPGSNTYTGQPIKINLQEVVVTASKKTRDFKVASNGFLIRSKDSNPVQFEEVPIQEGGKTVIKIKAENVEIFATEGKDKVVVEGDGNSIFGGSESDKFYVKGNGNDINPDSYNWTLSPDGKKVKTEKINKAGQYRTNITGSDRIFVYGKDNTVVTSDDMRGDKICTYESGNGLNSNKIDKQSNGKDYFYRYNDNYDPKNPVAVVFDGFDGPASHGNAVRNTLVKGGYDNSYNKNLNVKTFDFDMTENKWKTEFIDTERFPGMKEKLDELNNREFPEGSRERFNLGLEILEQNNITVDVINNSTDPNFFKATGDFKDGMKFTYKELEDLLGTGVKLHTHNLDKYRGQIIQNIDTKLKETQDPEKKTRLNDLKTYLQNKPQFYATYQDLSKMINEHRGPDAQKITISERNIDAYREELVQILDEDAKKPEDQRKTSWADIQYVREILADGKYPFVNAAGNERSGIGMIALTNESITVSGKEYDPTYFKESTDVHQSTLVDAQEYVEKYGHRGTSISAPLHCRRYIENKAKLFDEMQQANNTYFK